MGRYKYEAKNHKGEIVSGVIVANNHPEAVAKIKSLKLIPFKVIGTGGGFKGSNFVFFSGRVNFRDLQIYTRQFATLINAGIPVVDSLRILTNGLRPGLLKDASSLIKSSIEGGNRLSEAMAKSPSVFDRLYCNMVQAGEEAGILDTIMLRLAMYIEKNEKIKRQVKGALIYPASILVVASLVVVIIMVFVIPKFMEFFISNGAELPWLTSVVVAISNALINQWYLFVGGAIGIPYFINRVLQTPAGKNQFDRLMYDAPIFGELIQKSAIARLSRTLSTLLTAGVGMIEALDISSRTSGNIVVETALAKARDSVKAGRTLAAPLSRDKVFPDMVVQMISIGEQSGTLEKMLEKIADFYEDEVEVAAKALTSLMEPIMLVVLGGIIGTLVIAMYLPIFNMAAVIK